MTPEGIIKDLIKKWLKKHNISYWMVIPSAFGGSTGMSDYCCILPDGKWLAIEAKSPGKKATPIQTKFLDTINSNGGFGVVVDGEESLMRLQVLLHRYIK